jgi:hypothetical protein
MRLFINYFILKLYGGKIIILSNNIMSMTIEQKIVADLAKQRILTRPYIIGKAMEDAEYAKILITGDGLDDEVKEQYGENIEGKCDHESLTNEEIQEVFDNDIE